MVFGLGRRPGPKEVGATSEEEKRPEPPADFECIQGGVEPENEEVEPEHEEMVGGLVRVKMIFYAFKPDPSKARRDIFSALAIMTAEEYSALLDSDRAINPDLGNAMGFIDDKDEEDRAVEITPKAKMILEEEKTKKAIAERSRLNDEAKTPSDDGDELDASIEKAS